MNQATIIGNITADPVAKKTSSGTDVTTFSVATNKKWKNDKGEVQEQVQFHNCVAWSKLAEVIAQYGHKGMKVMCQGELATRNWEDDNGVKHYRTEIVVRDFEMLSKKQEGSAQAPQSTAAPQSDNMQPEDLPF